MNNLAVSPSRSQAGIEALRASRRLGGKRALITGGETPLGQAIAMHYAREGAHVALVCPDDCDETVRQAVQSAGRACIVLRGDIRELDVCDRVLDEVLEAFGGLDILINNPATTEATASGGVNAVAFATLYLTRNALRVMDEDGAVINAAEDDTVPAFTRSLAQVAARRGIRVNAVAAAPLPQVSVANLDVKKAALPAAELNIVTPSYVFLASDEARSMNGQVLHAFERTLSPS